MHALEAIGVAKTGSPAAAGVLGVVLGEVLGVVLGGAADDGVDDGVDVGVDGTAGEAVVHMPPSLDDVELPLPSPP